MVAQKFQRIKVERAVDEVYLVLAVKFDDTRRFSLEQGKYTIALGTALKTSQSACNACLDFFIRDTRPPCSVVGIKANGRVIKQIVFNLTYDFALCRA